jgi:hypothetical protein
MTKGSNRKLYTDLGNMSLRIKTPFADRAVCVSALAHIAQLEEALSDIAQMHGDNPSMAMADMPEGDYQRYILSQARKTAREALKETNK